MMYKNRWPVTVKAFYILTYTESRFKKWTSHAKVAGRVNNSTINKGRKSIIVENSPLPPSTNQTIKAYHYYELLTKSFWF